MGKWSKPTLCVYVRVRCRGSTCINRENTQHKPSPLLRIQIRSHISVYALRRKPTHTGHASQNVPAQIASSSHLMALGQIIILSIIYI